MRDIEGKEILREMLEGHTRSSISSGRTVRVTFGELKRLVREAVANEEMDAPDELVTLDEIAPMADDTTTGTVKFGSRVSDLSKFERFETTVYDPEIDDYVEVTVYGEPYAGVFNVVSVVDFMGKDITSKLDPHELDRLEDLGVYHMSDQEEGAYLDAAEARGDAMRNGDF